MQVMKPNNKGSALVWALVVTFVLVILIGSMLTAAFSHYTRSLNNNYEKQAYFTSRSVVDALSDEIKSGTANGNAILSNLVNVGDIINIDNISFIGDEADKGTTIATVELESIDSIKLTATTTVSGRSETVTLRLQKGSGTSYPISEEFPGLDVPADVIEVTDSFPIDGYSYDDIYAPAGTTVVYLNNAEYYGDIFAESGTTIQISIGSKF